MADYVNYGVNPYAPVKNYRLVSAATTNPNVIQPTKANLLTVVITNTAAQARTVKFYNKATAPAVGTDIPVLTITTQAGQSWTHNLEAGLHCPLGLGIGITATASDADTTVVAAGDVIVTALYI